MTDYTLDATDALPDPTEVGDGEFEKSRETRKRILDAMVGLIAERGFKACSTPAVAKAAGMSRTAMLYHFPSRRVLIEAVVLHVIRRRVEMHEELVTGLTRDRGFRDAAVDAGLTQVQSQEFVAFCELSAAARTDADLEEVFPVAVEVFDRARRDTARKLSEPEIADSPVFDLRRDVHRLLIEGMAKKDGITFDVDKRSAELFAFLKLIWSDAAEPLLEQAVKNAKLNR